MRNFITFSTWLTLARIFLAPCVMGAIYSHAWILACVFFTIAAITDLLDGYCARLYHQETELGRILDPVADKILLFSTLWAFYQVSGHELIPAWFIYLMIGKDVILLAGGLYLLMHHRYTVMSPSVLSKWVAALSMIFAVYLMFVQLELMSAAYIEQSLYILAAGMIIIMFDYSYKFIKRL